MEDMARLAVVEQSVRDGDKYSEILFELLWQITHILENPYDFELRTLKSDILKDVFKHDAFKDYLKYVGFQLIDSNFVYPKELTLNNLRVAQAAIERKISFCCGKKFTNINQKVKQNKPKKVVLQPTKVLNTTNPFLMNIQDQFNRVLEYEDEELQALARDQIPLVQLQLMALDRVREQQKRIKIGETKEHDLSFDVALLMELLGWFKYKFFSWVDQPKCQKCKGPTTLKKTEMATIEGEYCRVEVYVCECGGGATFPRHNSARTLLRTRRGRCGEWAHCFALLCRALGYDTRYVYDTTDHVWCEIFDYDSRTWLHADPCEAKLNTPLMYEHGWGKKLAYVIAFSRDDLQDVTWRYTLNHKETLSRRRLCSESALVCALTSLRRSRQAPLSASRRSHLARRTLAELVLLMQERKPTDYESHGRISGSKQWRSNRGEIGLAKGHTFEFTRPGPCAVQYHAGVDKYWVSEAGELRGVDGWAAGVYRSENIFRKVETDWKMVYLAREEGESEGSISWRFASKGDLCLKDMQFSVTTALYETGKIEWTVQYNDQEPQPLSINEGLVSLDGGEACVSVSVRARVRGGSGEVAWQHAQLCRTSLNGQACTLEFQANLQ